jgi:hypothetical protein
MSRGFFIGKDTTNDILHINNRFTLGTIEMHVESVLIFGNASINDRFCARETEQTALVVGLILEFKVLRIFDEIHAALAQ